MPRVTHLIRRNGVYWFRIDLPGDLAGRRLRPAVPDSLKPLESPKRPGCLKTAVWLSLRTTAEREAKTRVAQNVLRYEALFDGARAFVRVGHVPSITVEALQSMSPPLVAPTRGELNFAMPPTHVVDHASAIEPEGVLAEISNPTLPQWTISSAFAAWAGRGGAKGAKKPAKNTVTETKAALSRFVELHGDMPVHQIGKMHGREFRDAIAKLPKGLPLELRRLPLGELLALDLTPYEPRSAITINKSLTLLGAVLGQAEKDGYFDGAGWKNPFDVAFEVDASDEDYYEPFNKDELNALLATPVLASGERPIRGRGETAKWAPLVALLQGARRTEVIQLLVKDVSKDAETGIWSIRFDREGDKRIKTLSSIRHIPIHPQLVRLGFLHFVKVRRDLVGATGSLA